MCVCVCMCVAPPPMGPPGSRGSTLGRAANFIKSACYSVFTQGPNSPSFRSPSSKGFCVLPRGRADVAAHGGQGCRHWRKAPCQPGPSTSAKDTSPPPPHATSHGLEHVADGGGWGRVTQNMERTGSPPTSALWVTTPLLAEGGLWVFCLLSLSGGFGWPGQGHWAARGSLASRPGPVPWESL